MKSINLITKENFNTSFNITDILVGSVYYPASGLDATPIKVFAIKYNSFVNVDYSEKYEDVKNALESNFLPVGYKLIGIKDISKEKLSPNGFVSLNFRYNKHEKKRLEENDHIKELHHCNTRVSFAIWAVYELDPNLTNKTDGKAEQFSILHIGGEGCATLEALYVENKINPKAIAIIKPGESTVGNWTLFTNPKFRFYQSLRKNQVENGAEMPQYLLTDVNYGAGCFFGEYIPSDSNILEGCVLYEL